MLCQGVVAQEGGKLFFLFFGYVMKGKWSDRQEIPPPGGVLHRAGWNIGNGIHVVLVTGLQPSLVVCF